MTGKLPSRMHSDPTSPIARRVYSWVESNSLSCAVAGRSDVGLAHTSSGRPRVRLPMLVERTPHGLHVLSVAYKPLHALAVERKIFRTTKQSLLDPEGQPSHSFGSVLADMRPPCVTKGSRECPCEHLRYDGCAWADEYVDEFRRPLWNIAPAGLILGIWAGRPKSAS